MCVIFWAPEVRPTPEMVRNAFDANKDGAGIAWRETLEDGTPVVAWKKGITDVDEIVDLCATKTPPYVAHFRIASIGGIRQGLTHPFPIHKDATTALEGKTKGYVLFHNGHWTGWSDASREAAIRSGAKIPTGKWSDTRAMAWLCHIYGLGFMELLPEQKGIAFGPQDYDVFTGPGWKPVNGVWCSNDGFLSRGTTQRIGQFSNLNHTRASRHDDYTKTKYCRYGNCKETDGLDVEGYCREHEGGRSRALIALPGVSRPVNPRAIDITTMMDAEPGGASSVQQTPFRPPITGPFITVAEAEYLSSQTDNLGVRLLSKSRMKRIKHLYSQIATGKKKTRDNAIAELKQITLEVTFSEKNLRNYSGPSH